MPTDSLEKLKRVLIPIAVGLTIASCGGGGGGGDAGDNYPGYTEFHVERDSLDSGDLTDVSLTVHEINPDGVFVKLHYPASLKYQNGSAMVYSGDAVEWVATAPFDSASNGNNKYLVFRVSRPPENQTNRVAIGLTMRAVSGDPSAYIEVDLDNNDPTLPDDQEFDDANPQFSSDDRWNISIAGTIAATPTPAATGSATPAPSGSATPATTPTPTN
jgi:hypothetical protein